MSRHPADVAPRHEDPLGRLLRGSLRAEADTVRPDLGRAHAELVRRVESGVAERRRTTLWSARFRSVALPVAAAAAAAAVTVVVMSPRAALPPPVPAVTAGPTDRQDLAPDSPASPTPQKRAVPDTSQGPPAPTTAPEPIAPRGEVPRDGQVVATLELAVDDPATWVRRCGEGVPVRATVLVPPGTGTLTYHWYLNIGVPEKRRSAERTLPVDRTSDVPERVTLWHTYPIPADGTATVISMGLLITRDADGVQASGPVLWIPVDCRS